MPMHRVGDELPESGVVARVGDGLEVAARVAERVGVADEPVESIGRLGSQDAVVPVDRPQPRVMRRPDVLRAVLVVPRCTRPFPGLLASPRVLRDLPKAVPAALELSELRLGAGVFVSSICVNSRPAAVSSSSRIRVRTSSSNMFPPSNGTLPLIAFDCYQPGALNGRRGSGGWVETRRALVREF